MGEMARNGGIDTPSYIPIAIYYEDSDSVEYVRRDVPCIYRRVDELLTLVLSMDTRAPLGFRIKGFRHFYLKYLKGKVESERKDFLELISVFEKATSLMGDEVFKQESRKEAYLEAADIAATDGVSLKDLPKVA